MGNAKITRRYVVTTHWAQYPAIGAAQFKMKDEADHYFNNCVTTATRRGYTSVTTHTPAGTTTIISDTKGRRVVTVSVRVKHVTPMPAAQRALLAQARVETRQRVAAVKAAVQA